MAISKKTELAIKHTFDPKSCRHMLNGMVYVLHCHHYASLYTQLADDCSLLDGKKLLKEVAEDTFFDVLTSYYKENGITDLTDRISIAEQYYSATGLGKMRVTFAGEESGEVELLHSHVDEGWIKKWGKKDTPINFITCGYIAGMFSAIFNKNPRTFDVKETASIVSGADKSCFKVVRV